MIRAVAQRVQGGVAPAQARSARAPLRAVRGMGMSALPARPGGGVARTSPQARHVRGAAVVCAASDEASMPSSSMYYDPLLVGSPVPTDQCPCKQLVAFQDDFYMGLGTLSPAGLAIRLGKIGLTAGLLVGVPILPYAGLNDAQMVAAVLVIGCTMASFQLFLTTMAWEDLGDRLYSSTVEYKIKGARHAQLRLWPKTELALARDRLLERHTVDPAIARLTISLHVCGAGMLASLATIGLLEPKIEHVANLMALEQAQQEEAVAQVEAVAPVVVIAAELMEVEAPSLLEAAAAVELEEEVAAAAVPEEGRTWEAVAPTPYPDDPLLVRDGVRLFMGEGARASAAALEE